MAANIYTCNDCGRQIDGQVEHYAVRYFCLRCADEHDAASQPPPKPDEPKAVDSSSQAFDRGYAKCQDDMSDAAKAKAKPDQAQTVVVLRRHISDLETAIANARREHGKLTRHNQTLQNLLGAQVDAPEPDEPCTSSEVSARIDRWCWLYSKKKAFGWTVAERDEFYRIDSDVIGWLKSFQATIGPDEPDAPDAGDAKQRLRDSRLWDAALEAMNRLIDWGDMRGEPTKTAVLAHKFAEALVAESERRAKADLDKAEPAETEGSLCKQHNRWHCVECAAPEGGGDGEG